MVMGEREVERSKTKGDAERFSIYIFSIRNEVGSRICTCKTERTLQISGKCVQLHSHVYGLHYPICAQEQGRKINAMRRVVLKKSSALSRHKIWRSLLAI